MDPGLLIVLVIFVPLILLAFTARTRFALIPGVLVIIGACATFGMIEPVHDNIGGIGALANGVMAVAAIGLSIYGLILLAIGGRLYRKPERRQVSPLPVATAVAGVDKD
jgi:hypothetical protein